MAKSMIDCSTNRRRNMLFVKEVVCACVCVFKTSWVKKYDIMTQRKASLFKMYSTNNDLNVSFNTPYSCLKLFS